MDTMDALRGMRISAYRPSSLLLPLLLLLMVLNMATVKAEPDVLMEYCEDATFQAACPDDHVVMIEEARYGRMRTGQCLSMNYGSIGCSADVLHVMDRYCSGRRTCKVNVRDLVVEGAKPCPKDLRSYMEARYTCLPVVGKQADCCSSSSQARVRSSHGHIASIVTEETGCGSIDCPWLVEVAKGQRVNISLYEFALPSQEEMETVREKMPPFSKVCHVYAIIKEKAVGSALTLCAGEQRHRPLFTSTTNAVEIRIFTKKKMEREAYFVLKYEAMGCPDPQTPSNGWVKRAGDKVEIGCGDPEKVWQLVCHGNRWVGEAGNCSDALQGYNVAGVLDNILSLSPDLSIVVIVLVAMVIAFVILIVGVICLRRKWTRSSRGGRSTGSNPTNRNDEVGDVNKNNTLLNPALTGTGNGGGNGGSGHNYFRTWELQRHAPPSGRPGAQSTGGVETGMVASEPPLPPPPPMRPTMTSTVGADDGDGPYGVRYVEHVYESPTFHRKDVNGSGHGGSGSDPAQYYELDPEAEVFTPRSNGMLGERPALRTAGSSMAPPRSSFSSSSAEAGAGSSQRCSYPGTNAHEYTFSSPGNYTS